MQIFNVDIFGSDADWFMEQSCADKKTWIKKNTNVTDSELIDNFVKTCNRGKDDECAGCKKAKENEQNNISTAVPTEQSSIIAVGENQAESRTADTKRPKRNNQGS